MDERILRPLTEASYLTAGNAWRYRAILRHFYLQHESMRHFLYPEELLRELGQSQYFEQYGENELEQDLRQLVEWGNLVCLARPLRWSAPMAIFSWPATCC